MSDLAPQGEGNVVVGSSERSIVVLRNCTKAIAMRVLRTPVVLVIDVLPRILTHHPLPCFLITTQFWN